MRSIYINLEKLAIILAQHGTGLAFQLVPEVRALQQNLEVGPMLRMDHGVSINGGTPIAGWFITDSPIYLMDDLGIPPF